VTARQTDRQTGGAISIDVRYNVNAHKKKRERKSNELKKARESGNKADWCGGIGSGREVAYRKMLSVHEAVTWRRVASQ
jgi:hypothetical protein